MYLSSTRYALLDWAWLFGFVCGRWLSIRQNTRSNNRITERNRHERQGNSHRWEVDQITKVRGCSWCSGSMGTTDILPSRWRLLRKPLFEFVQSRPVTYRVSHFSARHFTTMPHDYRQEYNLDHQIESRESRKYLDDGTVSSLKVATGCGSFCPKQRRSRRARSLSCWPMEKKIAGNKDCRFHCTALEIAKSKGVKVLLWDGANAFHDRWRENLTQTRPRKVRLRSIFIRCCNCGKIATNRRGNYFRRGQRRAENIYNSYSPYRSTGKNKNGSHATLMKIWRKNICPLWLASAGFLFMEVLLLFTIFKKFSMIDFIHAQAQSDSRRSHKISFAFLHVIRFTAFCVKYSLPFIQILKIALILVLMAWSCLQIHTGSWYNMKGCAGNFIMPVLKESEDDESSYSTNPGCSWGYSGMDLKNNSESSGRRYRWDQGPE